MQKAIKGFVKSGAWFSHSEAVLLSMLCSSDCSERQLAVRKILGLRQGRELGDMSVPVMTKPALNLEVTTLEEFIDWQDAHEPVMSCSLNSEQLKDIIDTPMVVPYFPAHTQGVERVVHEVTVASASVYGFERRDDFIRGRAAHRELMPVFTTKRDLQQVESRLSQ